MEVTPTRSALLELRDERLVMEEGFHFLDEKRLLLAAEIVRLLAEQQRLEQEYRQLQQEAVHTLAATVRQLGLHGVQSHPATVNEQAEIALTDRLFFGVRLVTATLRQGEPPPAPSPVFASPEAVICREQFGRLLPLVVALAALSGNLQRLFLEYRRTERRARALEEVILPELLEQIDEIALRLEEMEQEETVRVRLGDHHYPETEQNNKNY